MDFVIDGHKLEFESPLLRVMHDVRDVYDENLSRSIENVGEMLRFADVLESDRFVYDIDVNNLTSNIHIVNNLLYEFKCVDSSINIRIFAKNVLVYQISSAENYLLSDDKYGAKIIPDKKSLYHYFSDGKTTVISDDLTNRIIKYSSSENVKSNLYTQYYEYLYDSNLVIYLVIINSVPHRLTVRRLDDSIGFCSFNFKY